MTKKHLVFLLAIVVVAGVMYIVKSKSNEKHRIVLREVIELHQGAEPTIEKIVEAKADLRKRIDLLKEEAKTLKEAAKKAKPALGKVVESKEEDEKVNHLSAKAAEIEALAQELEILEAELHSWKEDIANTIKGKKDKVSKEMHNKLEAAKLKFAQLNDRFGKSIEKVGQAMQQYQTQEHKEEKK